MFAVARHRSPRLAPAACLQDAVDNYESDARHAGRRARGDWHPLKPFVAYQAVPTLCRVAPSNTFPTRSRAGAARPPRRQPGPPRDLRPSRGPAGARQCTRRPVLAREEYDGERGGSGGLAHVRPSPPSRRSFNGRRVRPRAPTASLRDGLRPPLTGHDDRRTRQLGGQALSASASRFWH